MTRNKMRSEDSHYVKRAIHREKLSSIKCKVLANARTVVTISSCWQQGKSDATTQHSSGFISTEVTGVLHHAAAVVTH